MSENYVSLEMFKLWTESQEKIQKQASDHNTEILTGLAADIKTIAEKGEETQENMRQLVELSKEDNRINRDALEQHKTEFNTHTETTQKQIDHLYKLYKAQAKVLKSREPFWSFWKRAGKGLKTIILTAAGIFLTLVITTLYNNFISANVGKTQTEATENDKQKKDTPDSNSLQRD